MRLVNPQRVYGEVHERAAHFLTDRAESPDQLLLLPRAHQKSHEIACWVAWWITKHPDTTVLYVSATEDVAIAQLSAIKGILTCDVYRRYWPTMVNVEDAKRAKWAMMDIDVDHPARKAAGVRDHTVSARSVGGNTTGLHGDVVVFDDIVVPSNAYTEDGRAKVAAAYAQFTSIMNPGGFQKVCGTRYHGKDIYGMMIEMEEEVFTDEGEICGSRLVYQVMQEAVETEGVYLWPRTMHPQTKKWFGFNVHELAKIRAKYMASNERFQFYAQYYNSPDDPTKEVSIGNKFQYYDPRHLKCVGGEWWIKDKLLSIFAGGDLAYTTRDSSDYTAFAVVGVDQDGYIYILEVDQFKTDQYARYYESVKRLHEKWGFRKLRIEAQTGGANLVVKYIQDQARADGRSLACEGAAAVGDKTERCAAILEPRYESGSIWHYRGGWMSAYEDQMLLTRPSHDDLRDAVAIAVQISRPASKRHRATPNSKVVVLNSRYGGFIRG